MASIHKVSVGRRDKLHQDKASTNRDEFVQNITRTLDDIQDRLYEKALNFRKVHTREIDDKDGFYAYFTPQHTDKPEIHGGFAVSPWCGSDRCEEKIKEDLAVTIRCVPFENDTDNGNCICCGKSDCRTVIFAKAY